MPEGLSIHVLVFDGGALACIVASNELRCETRGERVSSVEPFPRSEDEARTDGDPAVPVNSDICTAYNCLLLKLEKKTGL